MKNYKDWFNIWISNGFLGTVVARLVEFYFLDDLFSVLYRASDVEQAPLIFKLHLLAGILLYILFAIMFCLIGTCIKLIKMNMTREKVCAKQTCKN